MNESLGIVYTGIMNDKGVRYTLVRHRNERQEQKRACKFDRDIFVAMVEQSPDSVCPPERNERFKLDSLPIRLSYRISAPRIERDRVQFRPHRVALYFLVLQCPPST